MLQALKQRFEKDEEGFTLIELMVVVLIIAILLAIAIPTFLGARERANDRAAQSSLRNALTAAKTIYTDEQDYNQADKDKLKTVEPSLSYQTSAVTTASDFKTVSVATLSNYWGGAAMSKSGTCFQILDASGAGGGTTYGKSASPCIGSTSTSAVSLTKW
jgi:type IV pilus assembly protein PilA